MSIPSEKRNVSHQKPVTDTFLIGHLLDIFMINFLNEEVRWVTKSHFRIQTALSFLLLFPLLLAATCSQAGDSTIVPIGRFSAQDLSGWEIKKFAKQTRYTFTNSQGRWELLARSDGSASGLVKKQKIDLNKTPYLNWSWRAIATPTVTDEKTKAGDDYAARVYVIFSTGPWFWNTHALNYVWSNRSPVETSWPNAFTSNAQMLAIRTKADIKKTPYTEKRNVKEDIKRIFGKEIDSLEAVAIMTDSDNSQTSASAAYGDIYFSAE
jgi:hypothetical protein